VTTTSHSAFMISSLVMAGPRSEAPEASVYDGKLPLQKTSVNVCAAGALLKL
jgi:hypothetical protein